MQNGGSRSRTVKAVSDGLPHCLLFSACRNSGQFSVAGRFPGLCQVVEGQFHQWAAGDPVAEVELAAAGCLDVRDDRGQHLADFLDRSFSGHA